MQYTFKKIANSRGATWALWAILLAELIAIAWWRSPWDNNDTLRYEMIGRSLAGGAYWGPSMYGPEPDALRVPGYPMFLALFENLLSMPRIVIIALHSAMYLAVIAICRRMLLDSPTERLTLLVLAVTYPFPIIYVMVIGTEAPAMLLVTVFAAIFVAGRAGYRSFAAAGLIAGLGAMFRSDLVLLVPLSGFLGGGWALYGRARWRRLIASALIGPAVALAVMLPYIIWNGATFGRFSPMPSASTVGWSLYLASWEDYALTPRGYADAIDLDLFNPNPVSTYSKQSEFFSEVAALRKKAMAASLATPGPYPDRKYEIALDKQMRAAAAQRVSAAPEKFIKHLSFASWRLWTIGGYPAAAPASVIAFQLGFVLLALVAILVLVGRWLRAGPLRADPRPLVVPIVLLALFVPHLPFHIEARYTAPIRPLMMVLATIGLIWLARLGGGFKFGLRRS